MEDRILELLYNLNFSEVVHKYNEQYTARLNDEEAIVVTDIDYIHIGKYINYKYGFRTWEHKQTFYFPGVFKLLRTKINRTNENLSSLSELLKTLEGNLLEKE